MVDENPPRPFRTITMAHEPKQVRTCSRCRSQTPRPGQRYCHACHAAYLRDFRRHSFIPISQLAKTAARRASNHAVKNGTIQRLPCEVCGSRAEKHHDDYSQPLSVRWLCKRHHLALHGKTLHVEQK